MTSPARALADVALCAVAICLAQWSTPQATAYAVFLILALRLGDFVSFGEQHEQ